MFPKKRKKNILAIGPQDVISKSDGGKESIFGSLYSLSKYYHIDYVFPVSDVSKVKTDLYLEYGITPKPLQLKISDTLRLKIISTLRLRPFKFEKYTTDEVFKELINVLGYDNRYDVIICHHPHVAELAIKYLKAVNKRIPVILREHNLEFEIAKSYYQEDNFPSKVFSYFYYLLVFRFEKIIWDKVDIISFMNTRDYVNAKKIFCKSKKFHIAREGISIPKVRKSEYPGQFSPLLFLLNPNANQSVVNFKKFIKLYWLPLKSNSWNIKLQLNVTRVDFDYLVKNLELSQEQIRSLNIVPLGFVKDLESVFHSSLALVSPVFIGGGMRKKNLEAMSYGLPVLASSIDINSTDFFKINENILCLDNVSEFQIAVERLQHDQFFWRYISKNAQRTVKIEASWDNYALDMKSIIERL